jgi:hypothetical protein
MQISMPSHTAVPATMNSASAAANERKVHSLRAPESPLHKIPLRNVPGMPLVTPRTARGGHGANGTGVYPN